MRRRQHAAISALLGALLGCAPAATPTTEVTTPTRPPPENEVVSAAELPLETVAAPAGLFASAHIPPLAELERQALQLAGARAGAPPKLGSHWLSHILVEMDRNAGTDCASSITWCTKHGKPEVDTACSLPLADYGRAKRQLALLYRSFRVERGVYRYFVPRYPGEPGSFAHPEEEELPSFVPEEDRDTIPWGHAACDLSRGIGPAPARLSCAFHNQSLERLRPWLTRGAPARAAPRDHAHLEVQFSELRRQTLPFLRDEARDALKDTQRLLVDQFGIRDPELLQVPELLVGQFFQVFQEATRLEAQAQLTDTGGRLTAELELAGAKSWPAQLVRQQLQQAAPPPELFWQLPLDSTSAGFAQGLDERHVRPVFDGLSKLLRVALQFASLDPRTLRAVDDLFSARPRADAAWVWARGIDESVQKVEPGDSSYVRELEAFASGFGWSAVGTETPHAEVLAWLDSAQRLVEQLHREAASNRGLLSAWNGAPRVKRRRAPRGFPRGSLAFDFEFPTNQEMHQNLVRMLGNASYLTPPSTTSKRQVLRLVAVPQGPSRTWIGLAFNHDLLQRKLRSVLGGKPNTQLAAVREQLTQLAEGGHALGGFTSVCDLARPSLGFSTYDYSGKMQAWRELVAATPRRGSTPIVYTLGGDATDHPKLRFETTLTRQSVVEALSMLPAFISGSEPPTLAGPVGIAAP